MKNLIPLFLATLFILGVSSCTKEKCASCSFTYKNNNQENTPNSDETCSSDENALAEFEQEFEDTYDEFEASNEIIDSLSCSRK